MNPENYLFIIFLTIFVFALLCALVWLCRRLLVQPRRKAEADEELARQKEERLFRLYQNMEEMMDNFEAYIEDTRGQMETTKGQMETTKGEMETTKAEVCQQIEKLGELQQRVEATEASASAAVATLNAAVRPDKPDAPAGKHAGEHVVHRSSRQEAIRELLTKGVTVEAIAQMLELSINEVRLVVYGLVSKNG